MAGTSLSAERVAELKEAWILIAGDDKASLSAKQVYKVYRALGMAPTDFEHRAYFARMKPTNGKVEVQEFIEVMDDVHVSSLANDKLHEAFHIFDKKRREYFDIDDLRRVMRSLGEDLTTDQLKDVLLEVDSQGDLKINRDEFDDMMAI